jgi:hypothetical protein
MKVKNDGQPSAATVPVKGAFTSVMRQTPKPPLAQPAKSATPPLVLGQPSIKATVPPGPKGPLSVVGLNSASVQRSSARVEVESKASTLKTVRSAHVQTDASMKSARVQHSETALAADEVRIKDLIQKDLSQSLNVESKNQQRPTPHGGEQPMFEKRIVQSDYQAPVGEGSVGVGEAKKKSPTTPDARAEAAVELIEKIDLFVKAQRPGLKMDLHQSLGGSVEITRVGKGEVAVHVSASKDAIDVSVMDELKKALSERGLRLTSLTVS